MSYIIYMKQLFLFLVTMILAFNGLSIATAQSTNERQEEMNTGYELFLRYLTNNPQYNTQVRTKINRLFEITFQDCGTIDSIQRQVPEIILTPAFRSDSLERNNKTGLLNFNDIHPTHGQWIDKNVVKGCGKTTQLNILATAYDLEKTPSMFPAVNGQTRIAIIDQANAEKAIAEKIDTQLDCFDSIFVLGSRFLGYKKANDNSITQQDENSGWYERWVVEACNDYLTINLAILPDPENRFEFIAQIAKEEG